MAYDIDKLSEALKQARQAAIEADPGAGNDGGSCNRDSAMIILKGMHLRIASKLNLRKSVARSGTFFVNVPSSGQANRNTVMVEAAVQKLVDLGYDAYVSYQID
jgi:hypothetical protein